MSEITIETEPVGPWQPLECFGGCFQPNQYQERAYLDGKMLNVSVANCGDPCCKKLATKEAVRLATYPEFQEIAQQ